MTLAEKRKEIARICGFMSKNAEPCKKCPLLDSHEKHGFCFACDISYAVNRRIIHENYDILVKAGLVPGEDPKPIVTPADNDPVNHPSHYCREGAMESIDEMVAVFGVEAVMHFCLCNAWKYRYRAMGKNGEEDLKKSDWYIKKFLELKLKGASE